jgi:hypothetical protein
VLDFVIMIIDRENGSDRLLLDLARSSYSVIPPSIATAFARGLREMMDVESLRCCEPDVILVGWLAGATCVVRIYVIVATDGDLTAFVCGGEPMDGLEYLFSSGAITID